MMDTEHSYLNELDGVYPAFQARSRLAQERLLRAGDAVFASKGYDKAHVTDIAAAAGYSIGTFYGRFRDKEALFAALQIRFARRGRANIDRFFDLERWHDATPAELIETYIEGTSRVLTRNSGFFRALYQRSLAGGLHQEAGSRSRRPGTGRAMYLLPAGHRGHACSQAPSLEDQ
jgi:AcrR family transcriptional regulator